MSCFRELRQQLAGMFLAAGVETPAVDAERLIAETAGFPRAELFLRGEEPVPEPLERSILRLAERRAAREPLQYLTGRAAFMDLELEVNGNVLIPRPETELLVEWAVRHLPQGGALLDLGTGSGAIALSVAAMRPDVSVTGVDLSPAALRVAERNRRRYCLERVRLLESDLFSAVAGEKFDLVAANLPYVTEEEYPALSPEVREFEPRLALVAGDGGMALLARAVRDLAGFLTPGGRAIFELSPPQAPRLERMLAETGAFAGIEVIQDYTRRDRFVAARRNG